MSDQSLFSEIGYSKHLKRIFFAVELLLGILFFLGYFFGGDFITVAALVTMIALLPVWYFEIKGDTETGSIILISILLFMLLYLAWTNYGLRDEAIVGLPGILLFAALLGKLRLLYTLILIMFINVFLMGWLNQEGFFYIKPATSDLTAAITLILILAIITYTVWLLGRDLNQAISDLIKENLKGIESQSQLEQAIHHDNLTGLPNRLLLKDRFEQSVRKSIRGKSKTVLIVIDIDNFKQINEELGQEIGDQVLIAVSANIQENLRDSDTIGRISGDEFIVILEDLNSTESITTIVEKLHSDLRGPLTLKSTTVSPTCSIGYAISPDHGSEFEDISSKADMAMTWSKKMGKNTINIFDKDHTKDTSHKFEISNQLPRALEKNEFQLYFQPKIDLKSHQLVGAEALIRWDNEKLGRIPPDMFINIAEQTGHINEIGQWVIETAIAHCASWQELVNYPVPVAINISSLQFKTGMLDQDIKRYLDKYRIPGDLVEIEFTESLFFKNSTKILTCLNALKREGVKLALDDFGTGYSNLGYLKEFEIHTLKIDQSFIRKISENKEDKPIVKAIIQMAESLDLQVVAEGVETEEVLDVLKELDCDIGQGNYWSKPLPAKEFKDYIKNF